METFMIQSMSHMPLRPNISEKTAAWQPAKGGSNKPSKSTKVNKMNVSNTTSMPIGNLSELQDLNFSTSLYSGLLYDPANSSLLWNGEFLNATGANGTFGDFDYDYQTVNATDLPLDNWNGSCRDWTDAQHNLYQTSNFLLAAAFLIPGSFKQSVLLVRALLTLGYLLLSTWAGGDVCSLDLFLWNGLLMLLNLTHTSMLIVRFLPPTLTLELTDLYLKVFSPLRVSKKHFKELVREGHVVNLEQGDIYAVEDVSPADERLSILLKGKLRVTCDDTHLHFITAHQFLDSPEWEANHEQSDDVFQVTITAEEDCVFLSWPRMRLERVLRHRPMLKTVLDCIIGKDITQKLYSLNEHISGLETERERTIRNDMWATAHPRSLSMDAVNTGTTGLVRSSYYKDSQRKHSLNSASLMGTIKGLHSQVQCWIPVVANHFPAVSPFGGVGNVGLAANDDHHPMDTTSTTHLLKVPEVIIPALVPPTPQRTRSFKKNREVKFQDI